MILDSKTKLGTANAAALVLLLSCGCVLLSACGSSETSTQPVAGDSQETVLQQLGESTSAYWFSGYGAGPIPNYDERLVTHLVNRFRMHPYVWGLEDMEGNPIPPNRAMLYQPFMSEASRWQGQHALDNTCYCPQDPPPDPPAPAGACNNTGDNCRRDSDCGDDGYCVIASHNSCCPIGRVNGQVKCVGPTVSCTDADSTEESTRWAMINRGPGEIAQEVYWTATAPADIERVPGEMGAAWLIGNAAGLVIGQNNAFGNGQVLTSLVPQECKEVEDPCEVGTCTDQNTNSTDCDTETNPECLGLCGDGSPCNIPTGPDPALCNPETFDRAFYWSFTLGRTQEPNPVLQAGIAYGLGLTADMMNPNGMFGVTPPGSVGFGVQYYEPSGPPQSIEVVVDGVCTDLDAWATPPMTMPPDPPAPDVGMTYTTDIAALPQGCRRYVFHTIDGEGFSHIYPSYGSLQISVLGTGDAYIGVDPNCDGWTPERVDTTCLPPADECNDGETRACYTGRDGSQDKGNCGVGTEACARGRWVGICDGEVVPELDDTCGDGEDNNCNGAIDEDCPIIVMPPDMGGGVEDVGMPDVGPADTGPPPTKGGEDEGCCTTVATGSRARVEIVALLALMFGFARRRK